MTLQLFFSTHASLSFFSPTTLCKRSFFPLLALRQHDSITYTISGINGDGGDGGSGGGSGGHNGRPFPSGDEAMVVVVVRIVVVVKVVVVVIVIVVVVVVVIVHK